MAVGAFNRLRLGLLGFSIVMIALLMGSIAVLRTAELRWAAVQRESVPLAIALDQLSLQASGVTVPAAALLAAPMAPEARLRAAELAQLEAELALRLTEITPDSAVDLSAANDLAATLEQKTTSMQDLLNRRDRNAQAGDARLQSALTSLKRLQQQVTQAGVVIAAKQADATGFAAARRMSKAAHELTDIEGGIQDLIKAETLAAFSEALAIVNVNFRDFFLILSRHPDGPDRTDFAISARQIFEDLTLGAATEEKAQALQLTEQLHNDVHSIFDILNALQAEISNAAHNQRGRLMARAAEIQASTARGEAWLIAALLFAILMSSLFVYFMIERPITARLVHIRNQAQRVYAGDLSGEGALEGEDEIAMLSRGIDDLREMTLSSRQLEADLRTSTERAERLAASKSNFLSMMSHEIRTPLNAIMGLFELIESADIPDRQKLRAHHGRRAAMGLFELLTKVLDASRLEADSIELNFGSVQLDDIAMHLEQQLSGAIQKSGKPLKGTVTLDPKLPADMMTDGARLLQVMSNLIDNSVRFTAKGRIDVAGALIDLHGAPGVVFSVTDTGEGISPADQQIIFEQFRQADATITRKAGGSGLGLAITRKLVTLLRGTITVTSAPGQGAEFTVRLPIAAPVKSEERADAFEYE